MDPSVWAAFALNLIAIIGGGIKGISVLLSVRDEIRDMNIAIGTKVPPEGLLGDVEALKRENRKHRDRLIELGADLQSKSWDRS
jgi:hypothetical protein